MRDPQYRVPGLEGKGPEVTRAVDGRADAETAIAACDAMYPGDFRAGKHDDVAEVIRECIEDATGAEGEFGDLAERIRECAEDATDTGDGTDE